MMMIMIMNYGDDDGNDDYDGHDDDGDDYDSHDDSDTMVISVLPSIVSISSSLNLQVI